MVFQTSQFHYKHKLSRCSAPQLFFLSLPAFPFPLDNGGTVSCFTASQRPVFQTMNFRRSGGREWEVTNFNWTISLQWLVLAHIFKEVSVRKRTSYLTWVLRLTLTFRTFHNKYWLCRSSEPFGAWFCNCFYQQLMVSVTEHVLSSRFTPSVRCTSRRPYILFFPFFWNHMTTLNFRTRKAELFLDCKVTEISNCFHLFKRL